MSTLTDTLTNVIMIDISIPIHPSMPTYPGDPGVEFEAAMDMEEGAAANVTVVHMGSQTGTHFDTPHHILNNGITSEQLPLELCYGPAQVIEIDPDIQQISQSVLEEYDIPHCQRLLLKTRNSGFWQSSPNKFNTDFAALTPDGAQYLSNKGVRLVGIDYLSIELYDSEGLGAHKALLNQDVVILEGINLTDVAPGEYVLVALPIKYQGLDGAPTRAVLLKP